MIRVTDNIIQHIRDNTSQTVIDTIFDIDDPEDSVIVREIGSSNTEQGNWKKQEVQVFIQNRGKEFATTRDNAEEIFDLLNPDENNITYPAPSKTGGATQYIARADVQSRPFSEGLKDGFYWYTLNVIFTILP